MADLPIASFAPNDSITIKEDGKDVLYIVIDPTKFLAVNIKDALKKLDPTPIALSPDTLGKKLPPPGAGPPILDWLTKEINKKLGK